RNFIASAKAFAARHGYVVTLAGRRRLLPDIGSDIAAKRAYAERQAVNSIIQGSAADIMKAALVLVDRQLRERALGDGSPRVLLQIHDELLLECSSHTDSVRTLASGVAHVMTATAPQLLEFVASAPGGIFTHPVLSTPAGAEAARLLGGNPKLSVPLAVNVEVGQDWGHMTALQVTDTV
ncbi:hypothetical protein EON67_01970, partial [archaeon]